MRAMPDLHEVIMSSPPACFVCKVVGNVNSELLVKALSPLANLTLPSEASLGDDVILIISFLVLSTKLAGAAAVWTCAIDAEEEFQTPT